MRCPQFIGSEKSLDSITACLMNELIVDCGSTTNTTLTHVMQSARIIADKIATIHYCNIIWGGPAGENNTPHNDFVHEYIHGQIDIPPENKKQAYL